MTIKKKLEIFRAGRHTSMNGQDLIFTAADIRAIVKNYSPAVHEAPIVVGHPTTDAPAYGWVSGLSFSDADVVEATPSQVEPQFASIVNAGRYKKISASLFPPGHPAHPLKGKPGGNDYYLKHVGMLGAAAPAVTGLKQASFSAGDDFIEVEFSMGDSDAMPVDASGFFSWLARGFASFINSERHAPADHTPALPAKPQKEIEDMATAEENAKREKELADREKLIADREAAFAAQEKTRKESEAKARLDAATEFCAGLVKSGQLLPADTPKLAGALAAVDALEVVSYANGDGTSATASPGKVLRDLLGGRAKVTNFSVKSGGDKADPPAANRRNASAPDGVQFAADELDLDAKAQAYAAQHNCDYVTAVKAVQAAA